MIIARFVEHDKAQFQVYSRRLVDTVNPLIDSQAVAHVIVAGMMQQKPERYDLSSALHLMSDSNLL